MKLVWVSKKTILEMTLVMDLDEMKELYGAMCEIVAAPPAAESLMSLLKLHIAKCDGNADD